MTFLSDLFSKRNAKAHSLLSLLCLLPVLGTIGCASFGGSTIETTHKPFNQAVSLSEDEQLLLNLVRLRYRDNPFFLEVTQIASTQSWTGSAGFGANIINQNPQDTYTPSFGTSYSNSPTVSYSPLQGEEFIQQMLAPIPLLAVAALTGSGWSVERVLSVTAERMNHVRNAPSASGPTPEFVPVYAEFNEISNLLRSLQKRGGVRITVEPGEEINNLELVFDSATSNSSEALRVKEILGVDAGASRFKLRQNFATEANDHVRLSTRSMLGALFYLCNAVEVPESHIAAGKVVITQTESGKPFDWGNVIGKSFRVHSSESPGRPGDAFVAVRYRNAWFYLKDGDLESKSTFMLLNQLFNLQSGNIKKVAPTLTIPVR